MERKRRHDHFIAGGLAGGGATAVLHPLDLVKVRFQVDQQTAMRPALYTFRTISGLFGAHGLPGLYQGFSANWTASMASWALYFYLYDRLKDTIGVGGQPSTWSWRYFAASGAAGALTISLVNPLWVVKTRMCLQTPGDPAAYRSMPNALARIAREEGVRGLYRGLVPGLFGVSHGAVQFTVYENLKALLRRLDVAQTNASYLGMSTASKVAAMLITYPYQVVRSRIQVPAYGSSVAGIVRQTWRVEGARGFYKGLVPSTLRVLPGTAITFLIYENVLAALK